MPTLITEGPEESTKARKGSTIILPCKVSHDPRINYTREWRSNNIAVTDSRYVVKRDGSLEIQLAQNIDTGVEFSCHVYSFGGNVTVKTSLSIIGKH